MVRNVSEEIFADFLNALDRVKNFPKRVHGKIGGLRYSELTLIFAIGELREKNGNVIATDLASSLLVSRAAVTPTIRVLTKKGLIDRKVESSDGRKAGLFLTEKGESCIQGVYTVAEQMEQLMFRGMSREEILLLKRLLLQIKDNLSERKDIQ